MEYYYNFKKGDYHNINCNLSSYNWNENVLNIQDVNIALDNFYETINDQINKFVPKVKKKLSTYPNWFSNYLKE